MIYAYLRLVDKLSTFTVDKPLSNISPATSGRIGDTFGLRSMLVETLMVAVVVVVVVAVV